MPLGMSQREFCQRLIISSTGFMLTSRRCDLDGIADELGGACQISKSDFVSCLRIAAFICSATTLRSSFRS